MNIKSRIAYLLLLPGVSPASAINPYAKGAGKNPNKL